MNVVERIRRHAGKGRGSKAIAIVMRLQGGAARVERLAEEHGITLPRNPQGRPTTRNERAPSPVLPPALITWATDGEKNEERYGGYVTRLGRLVWQPGAERVPFPVRAPERRRRAA